MEVTNKLVLGTVQFGIDYGITNDSGKTPEGKLEAIFNLAKQSQIDYLDTAQAYGDAEVNIGKYAGDQFEIISKFPALQTAESMLLFFAKTLDDVRKKTLYGYMAHNADTLIQYPQLWATLENLKAQGKIQKIGYSLYTVEQLDKLLSMNIIPDIIQIPYSLFDLKFSARFDLLKSMKTEVHVRSVFLQGLYFMDSEKLQGKLTGLKEPLKKLHSICEMHKIDVASLALNYALANPFIDKVVMGVNTIDQLQSNIEMAAQCSIPQSLIEEIENIHIPDPLLLNPASWN